ncbi:MULTISPECIES: HAD-IA family hydrolase [unclassified Moritella]|uniref:HAD-IA family hydrolase n=1 Tax=unclassified Moritella TaxID=2637987 RepID=UPI002012C94E|nr:MULTISPECIES: HAD-IA family hydrolase [unclassified Moritella]
MINRYSCKGFIFDVDATLVNTTLVINNIWKKWAGQNGIDFSIVYPHVHGRKISETLELVGSQYANADEENVVKKIAIEAMESATEIDGALSFVENIPKCSWAIATSGPRKVAETSLLASGFKLPMNMVCAEDVIFGKPHPEPFALAAKNLGLKAVSCVAFEDSPAGVKSAKEAGCFTVAILTSHKESELVLADLIVDGFSDLAIENKNGSYELCW